MLLFVLFAVIVAAVLSFELNRSSQTKDVLADKSIALCANLREKEHDSNKRESGWASLISKRK